MTFSPTRAPDVRQPADIFPLDARVHINSAPFQGALSVFYNVRILIFQERFEPSVVEIVIQASSPDFFAVILPFDVTVTIFLLLVV